MTVRLPKPATKARFLLIGYGLVLLFWMGLEDSGTLTVAMLGTGTAIIYGGAWIANYIGDRDIPLKIWLVGCVILGAFMGALSVLSIATLMFFKSSWHGHTFPDYPAQMIIDMFTRLPIWSLSGALLGLSCAIILFLYHANLNQIPSGNE